MPYVTRLENGDILLQAGELLNKNGPGGLKITQVVLSRLGITVPWFTEFLAGNENNPVEHEVEGTTYKTSKNVAGNVYLRSQSNNIAHLVGYTPAEIPVVLEELRRVTNDGQP